MFERHSLSQSVSGEQDSLPRKINLRMCVFRYAVAVAVAVAVAQGDSDR
jgi:hypothetical protein